MWYTCARKQAKTPRVSAEDFPRVKVRLTRDLTRYEPTAQNGTEGIWHRDGKVTDFAHIELPNGSFVDAKHRGSYKILDRAYMRAHKAATPSS